MIHTALRISGTRPRSADRGSVLLAVAIVVLALAGLSAAFMQSTVRESAGNVAADQRTRLLFIAESGANHAVSEILRGGDGNIGAPDTPVAFGGGLYWVRTTSHGDGSYTVKSTGALNAQRRAIEVVVAPDTVPLFSKALFGDLDLGAHGSVFTDSYDSEKGPYADQATNYDEKAGRFFAKDKGNLGSNRNVLLRGGVKVIGDATPGPGYTVQISGTNVYVRGSTAPAEAPNALAPIEYAPPVAATGSFNTSKSKTLNSGVYRYENFTASSRAVIDIQGDVTLYVDNSFNVAGKARMVLQDGASLTLYHAGSSFSLTGGGMVNNTQVPSKFKVFSSATTVKFAGNSTFYGAVYAPNATISPTGTSQIFGSFVGRQIDIGGTADFHYDTALSRESEEVRTRLKRVSWRKVPPTDM